MTEYNAQNPLEVQILRNVYFFNTGNNRLWCKVATIEPITDTIGIRQGMIRGFQSSHFNNTFTRYYFEGEDVEFKMHEGSPHGELRVGNETYHVEARNTMNGGTLQHDVKRFAGGYNELWSYLRELPDWAEE